MVFENFHFLVFQKEHKFSGTSFISVISLHRRKASNHVDLIEKGLKIVAQSSSCTEFSESLIVEK
jgi:hypothetical protein